MTTNLVTAVYVTGDIYPTAQTDPAKVVSQLVEAKVTVPILGLFQVNASEATCPDSNSPTRQS